MEEKELLNKLKELVYFMIEELSDAVDLDAMHIEDKMQEIGLLKRVDAPKDDEHAYYLFPIWAGDQEIRNTMPEVAL